LSTSDQTVAGQAYAIPYMADCVSPPQLRAFACQAYRLKDVLNIEKQAIYKG